MCITVFITSSRTTIITFALYPRSCPCPFRCPSVSSWCLSATFFHVIKLDTNYLSLSLVQWFARSSNGQQHQQSHKTNNGIHTHSHHTTKKNLATKVRKRCALNQILAKRKVRNKTNKKKEWRIKWQAAKHTKCWWRKWLVGTRGVHRRRHDHAAPPRPARAVSSSNAPSVLPPTSVILIF